MIVLIFLCTIIFQAHAANEVSDLAPADVFINRLQVEKEKDNSKDFVFKPIDKKEPHAETMTANCDAFKETVGFYFGEHLISLAPKHSLEISIFLSPTISCNASIDLQ